MHGGKSPRRHGRYSKIPSKSVREIIEQLETTSVEERLHLLPEADMIRALAQDYINRYTELKDALLAWNQAEFAEKRELARPQRIPDLHEASKLLVDVSKVVEKIHKREAKTSISQRDFYRVMAEITRIVNDLVEDQDVKARIREAWLSVCI
jgi:hypothetical protein